ncbi:ATP-binding cassette domain-containing protein, partial [Mycobacterium marinum]|uniref:ATP-binding cassette domain-containing protein n=1 Tax=Mycobacterium marinum TaxID=1781 RepID=UPI003FF12CD4
MTASAPLAPPHRGGPLRPGELAQASVMAALCAVTAIISVVVPFAAGLALLGTVPTGLLAYRYRLRVLVAATVAAGVIAFLIAGLGGFMGVVHSAYIGGLTGIVKRKGRGTPTVIVSSLIAGLAFGSAMVGMLAALTRLRHLIFKVMTANVEGLSSFMARMGMEGAAEDLKRYFAEGLHYWSWVLLGYFTVAIMVVSLIGWWALSRLLERMRGIPDVHKLDAPVDGEATSIEPVPVRLDKVRFRYPGAGQDALREVSLDVRVGEHIAITGANGSGKTTLMLILAGREPTSGTVERPGAVGLGKLGGTAVVLQHPESQVLGTRVADDVVWGLPPGTKIDVDQQLAEVGLEGLAE